MFEAFDNLLSRKNQRFICRDTGWPEPGPDRHTAHIHHEIGPPLDSASLHELRAALADLPELLEFYRRYGSARLYCDTVGSPSRGYASAYYIAPPDTWPELKELFDLWLEVLSDEEREELLPPWIEDYVVIGEVPNSGNYFVVPLVGDDRGKVIEFEHDGFEFLEAGKNLADFLNRKSTVNEQLLWEILGHTRYSDGRTDTQWLCEAYRYDE